MCEKLFYQPPQQHQGLVHTKQALYLLYLQAFILATLSGLVPNLRSSCLSFLSSILNLTLRPFNTVHAVVTPTIKSFLLLLHNCNFVMTPDMQGI